MILSLSYIFLLSLLYYTLNKIHFHFIVLPFREFQMPSSLPFLIGTGLDNHFFGTTHVSSTEFPQISQSEHPRGLTHFLPLCRTRSPPVNFGMCPFEAYSAFMFIIQLPPQRNKQATGLSLSGPPARPPSVR